MRVRNITGTNFNVILCVLGHRSVCVWRHDAKCNWNIHCIRKHLITLMYIRMVNIHDAFIALPRACFAFFVKTMKTCIYHAVQSCAFSSTDAWRGSQAEVICLP